MSNQKNILNLLRGLILLASVGLAPLLCGASPALAADAPDLGAAATFGVLSSTYTNTVAGTTINGDLGYTTGPASAPTVNGTTYQPPSPTYSQAGLDQATALAVLNNQICTDLGPGAVNLDTVNIGSGPGVFTPGCYYNGGAMNITVGQTVTLNGVGVYIFRPGGALTTQANTSFILQGDVCESDVYWAPVGATTIGATTDFVGNILDPAGITIGENSNLTGRALAYGGTVTTDKNTITVPTCPALAAQLELLKTVDNTGGGTASATDFTLTATGPTVVTGTTPVGPANVPVGIYTLTETGPVNYTDSGFSCTGGGTLVGNSLTITGADAGNIITCTIANTYNPAGPVAAQLGLLKTVDNTGGGTASATDFTLTATGDAATGPTVVTGTTPVGPANVPVGIYTLTETGPVNYTDSGFSCTGGGTLVGNSLTITGADAGNIITCTIANTYNPAGPVAAQLGLLKTVNNTGGGTALATDFTLTATGDAATGPTVVTGTTPVGPANVPVGIYTLTETGPVNYTDSGFSCTGGGTLVGNSLTITGADAGNIITCTIANTYNPAGPVAAQLGLLKTVNNTGGGTALATDFTLTATGDAATGPTVVTGTTPVGPANVPVGIYTLTETGPVDYTDSGFSCTGGGTLVGNSLTITGADAGNTITCTIDNTYNPVIPPGIPTVNEWGMIILMVLMGLGSIYYLRRRKMNS